MPPSKGTLSNNPNGRPQGVPNKLTAKIRAAILAGCIETLNDLPRLLALLDPKDRIDALAKLLRYVAPTMKSIEIGPDTEGDRIANMTTEEREARLVELLAKYNDQHTTDE